MKTIKKYTDFLNGEHLLREKLGISDEVEKFSNYLYSFISVELINKEKYIEYDLTKINYPYKNFFKYNKVVVESDVNFNFEANISENNNILILKFNPKYIIENNDLKINITHEIQHIFTYRKGLKINISYNDAMSLKNFIDPNIFPYTSKFLNMIYYTSPTEIYAITHEIFTLIDNDIIKTKMNFRKFILNNQIWKYADYLEKSNIVDIWSGIMKEKTDDIIIEHFKIKNIKKWLIYLNKLFINSGKEYKKRLAKLSAMI